jgi:hypothetical protein
MRSYIRSILPLLVLGLLALAGCQKKLNEEKTFTLTAGEVRAFPVDAPIREQQLSVTVTAAGSSVNVHIVPESAHAATMEAMQNLKKLDPAKVLASKEKVENDTLEATIPAKTGFSVFISGAKKQAEVTVKIVGK